MPRIQSWSVEGCPSRTDRSLPAAGARTLGDRKATAPRSVREVSPARRWNPMGDTHSARNGAVLTYTGHRSMLSGSLRGTPGRPLSTPANRLHDSPNQCAIYTEVDRAWDHCACRQSASMGSPATLPRRIGELLDGFADDLDLANVDGGRALSAGARADDSEIRCSRPPCESSAVLRQKRKSPLHERTHVAT